MHTRSGLGEPVQHLANTLQGGEINILSLVEDEQQTCRFPFQMGRYIIQHPFDVFPFIAAIGCQA